MCLTLAARPVASSKGTSFPCNDPQDSDGKNAAHSSDNCLSSNNCQDGAFCLILIAFVARAASGLLTVSVKRAACTAWPLFS